MLIHGRPDTGNKVINIRILTLHAWHQSLVPDIHGQVGPHNPQQMEVAHVAPKSGTTDICGQIGPPHNPQYRGRSNVWHQNLAPQMHMAK